MANLKKAELQEVEELLSKHGVYASNSANFPIVCEIIAINHFDCDEIICRIGVASTDSEQNVEKQPIKRYKIREDKEERSFFSDGSTKFYLDDCIRHDFAGLI